MSTPRRLMDLGERGLLAELQQLLAAQFSELPLGFGDDVSITRPTEAVHQLHTMDTMVEGTHFRWWPELGGHALGRKLAAVNLSDLASKGAQPRHAMLSFGVPGGAELLQVRDFFNGLVLALNEAGARLIGGDSVLAPQWSLTLSLCGELPTESPIAARSSARDGMSLFVTGYPGESAAGLEILEGESATLRRKFRGLIARHLSPEARLTAGRLLVRRGEPIAMIDVSDGVAHEAALLGSMSSVCVTLEESALPVSEALAQYAEETGEQALDLLLYGGEDYELLFATDATEEELNALFSEGRAGVQVTRIGSVSTGAGLFLRRRDGTRVPLGPGGFDHFTPDGAR